MPREIDAAELAANVKHCNRRNTDFTRGMCFVMINLKLARRRSDTGDDVSHNPMLWSESDTVEAIYESLRITQR